jgi:sugar lactone lactonase YvrE
MKPSSFKFACSLALVVLLSCGKETVTNTVREFPYRMATSVAIHIDTVSAPVSLAIDASGNIYASNPTNGIISRIRTNKTVEQFATTGTNVGAIAFGPSGELFASCYGDGTLKKVGSSGGSMTTVKSGINNPSGIAFDASGNMYVGAYSGDIIWKITSTGTETIFANIVRPSGLIFDHAGNLLVGDQAGHTIRKITPSGTQSFFAYGVPSPHTLVFDSKGNLFASESKADSKCITVIASDGFVYQLSDEFTWPTGMVFDQVGNLFVANYAGNSISKVVLTP